MLHAATLRRLGGHLDVETPRPVRLFQEKEVASDLRHRSQVQRPFEYGGQILGPYVVYPQRPYLAASKKGVAGRIGSPARPVRFGIDLQLADLDLLQAPRSGRRPSTLRAHHAAATLIRSRCRYHSGGLQVPQTSGG